MPIKRGSDKNGCFYRWGNQKKYYYECGNATSRMDSKKKAIKQMIAISYSSQKYRLTNIMRKR